MTIEALLRRPVSRGHRVAVTVCDRDLDGRLALLLLLLAGLELGAEVVIDHRSLRRVGHREARRGRALAARAHADPRR